MTSTVNRWTGRETRLLREALRMSQRQFAEHLGVSDRAVAKWESGGSSYNPRPETQALLDTALERATPEESERFQTSGAPPAGGRMPRPTQIEDVVMTAAEESARFAARAEASNVGPHALEQLEGDVRRVVEAYPTQPVDVSFAEVRALRDRSFDLLDGRQPPQHTRDLYLAAGVLCGVLANACFDLGRYAAAETQARTAFLCGELAGHNGLRTWVRGMQALTAYWDGRPADAAKFAGDAARFTPEHGTAAVRAHSIHARALAQLGDREGATAALAAADTAAENAAAGPLFSGMLDFPRAKQMFYAATAHLWLDETGHAAAAERLAADAVTLYNEAPAHQRRLGELSLARLDLATARLALNDADGAVDALHDVVAVSAARPTESVARRVGRFGRDLAAHPAVTSRPGVVMRELVAATHARPAVGGFS